MARVTAFTADRMLQIEQSAIIGGAVLLDDLVLTRKDGTSFHAGNVRGPQGIQGIQGVQGIQGPSGTITSASSSGLAAGATPTITLGGTPQARTFAFGIPKGDQGIQGIQGIKGDQGLKGDQGIQGVKGDQGIQGIKGDQGIQGLKGDQGLQGIQGIQGIDGSAASPAGTIALWGSDVAPTNWLICDGSAVSRTTYASLFSVVGTKYGAGDGVNTFNLPNLKGQTPIGKDAAQTEFAALNQKGGEKTHLLTIAEMPSHNHTTLINRGFIWNETAGSSSYAVNNAGADLTSSTGGGAAHNNLQPYTVVNFIIKITNGDTPNDSQLTQRVSTLETTSSNLAAGTIQMWGGDIAPTNWLVCDGAAVSRTTYASLFAAISTKYGAGDGSTTFNLPNLKGRVPVGKDASQTEFAATGQNGGEKTHLLTINEMPSHTHSMSGVLGYGAGAANSGFARVDANSAQYPWLNPGNTGGGAAHNILQPYLTVNFIIKITNGDTQGDSQLTTRVSTLESGTQVTQRIRDRIYRLQRTMTGGGVRKHTLDGLTWNGKLRLMSGGNDDLTPANYYNVEMPPNGTVIPVYGSATVSSVTVANGYVSLYGTMSGYSALYYDVPLGSTSIVSDPSRFKIVDINTAVTIPPTWILICARNQDNNGPAYLWGDGRAEDYWRSVTFVNSWGNYTYDGSYAVANWRFESTGRIMLQGLIAGGTIGATAFSIPAVGGIGFGPANRMMFNQLANVGMARVDVLPTAEIVVYNVYNGGGGQFISMDGIGWHPGY